jgi:ferredoxin
MQTSEPEDLYRRLREHLDRNYVGFPTTESGVELRILTQLFTPEEAEIAIELSAIPEPAAKIHKRLKGRLTLEELVEKLDRMEAKGIIAAHPAGGERRYLKLVFAVGMYERQVATLTPELERDTRQYMEEGFDRAFHTKKTTQLRVVPVNKKIPVEHNVASYDEIRAHIQTSPGPFGAIPCICRKGHALLGGKCRQTEASHNCLMVGPAAVWAASSGAGIELTREEMLAALDRAEEEGLVLQPENTKSPMFICNCCGCCCNVLAGAKRLPAPAEYFSANFYAEVDVEACQSCGVCIDRCQMDAITNPEGTALVDLSRCIGCGLCLSTCPSGAMRLVAKKEHRTPPNDTQALYTKLFQERYGAAEMMAIGARMAMGKKV